MGFLFDQFKELESSEASKTRDIVVKAPFGYPGGKSRSVEHIGPLLPRKDVYVSVFGGSGIDLIWRKPGGLEVFNDRFSGVTDFYRCLRNPKMFQRLCEWLELTVHSREEFIRCRDEWENTADSVERAARWYYSVVSSFGSLGRNFGRATSSRAIIAGKIGKKLKYFPQLHARFRDVQIENLDWRQCLSDYDSPSTVFYCDPPYVDANKGIYKFEMTVEEHRELIARAFDCKGFVAISGYTNPLYENQKWDDRHEWITTESMQTMAFTEGSTVAHLKGQLERGRIKEVLWIKEARG